jgi:hypothetical protein
LASRKGKKESNYDEEYVEDRDGSDEEFVTPTSKKKKDSDDDYEYIEDKRAPKISPEKKTTRFAASRLAAKAKEKESQETNSQSSDEEEDETPQDSADDEVPTVIPPSASRPPSLSLDLRYLPDFVSEFQTRGFSKQDLNELFEAVHPIAST